MSEWVLVPETITDEMFDAGFDGSDHLESWRNTISARPTIPRAVWDAMVERGARTVVRTHFDGLEVTADYVEAQVERDWRAFRGVVADTLRAALGNPRVEGDAP